MADFGGCCADLAERLRHDLEREPFVAPRRQEPQAMELNDGLKRQCPDQWIVPHRIDPSGNPARSHSRRYYTAASGFTT